MFVYIFNSIKVKKSPQFKAEIYYVPELIGTWKVIGNNGRSLNYVKQAFTWLNKLHNYAKQGVFWPPFALSLEFLVPDSMKKILRKGKSFNVLGPFHIYSSGSTNISLDTTDVKKSVSFYADGFKISVGTARW